VHSFVTNMVQTGFIHCRTQIQFENYNFYFCSIFYPKDFKKEIKDDPKKVAQVLKNYDLFTNFTLKKLMKTIAVYPFFSNLFTIFLEHQKEEIIVQWGKENKEVEAYCLGFDVLEKIMMEV
jgi:hypothetical protein